MFNRKETSFDIERVKGGIENKKSEGRKGGREGRKEGGNERRVTDMFTVRS